jgi:DNA-binding response OmpR family regulator
MPTRQILIVDDDPVVRHIAHTALKANGFQTTVASDGMSALAQTQRIRPDLIILDLGLPAGGGFLFLQRVKSIPALALIPVLIVSGQDRATNETRSLEAGAKAYLQKPVSPETLVAKVQELLGAL